MKKEVIDNSLEMDTMIGLITSDEFCREICPILRPHYFETTYFKTLSGYIIDYFNEYKEAPKNNIKSLFEMNREKFGDKDLADNIWHTIKVINDKFKDDEKFRTRFQIKKAISFARRRSIALLIEEADNALDQNDIEGAEKIVKEYKSIQHSGRSIVDLKDVERITASLNQEKDKIFQFKGDLGKLCGPFYRGEFIAYAAPPKVGKTWYLMYSAKEAYTYGNNVLFVSFEMTEDEINRRFCQLILGGTLHGETINKPAFKKIEDDEGDVKYKLVHHKITPKHLDENSTEAYKHAIRRYRYGKFLTMSFPTYSFTVKDLEKYLDELENRDGWIPDVICIDYADLMRPEARHSDYRDSLNEIWARLRGLAKERNCLLFTASQTNRQTIGKHVVSSAQLAEDVRKVAHASCLIGISQRAKEADKGLMYFVQLEVRESWREYRHLYVAYNYNTGNPVLDSKFVNQVITGFEDDTPDEGIERKKNKSKNKSNIRRR